MIPTSEALAIARARAEAVAQNHKTWRVPVTLEDGKTVSHVTAIGMPTLDAALKHLRPLIKKGWTLHEDQGEEVTP